MQNQMHTFPHKMLWINERTWDNKFHLRTRLTVHETKIEVGQILYRVPRQRPPFQLVF